MTSQYIATAHQDCQAQVLTIKEYPHDPGIKQEFLLINTHHCRTRYRETFRGQ